MAQIVLGMGTSHGPMLSMPPEMWLEFGADDKHRTNLVAPWDGSNVTYEDLLEHADPTLPERLTLDHFREQAATAQNAIGVLRDTLAAAHPDAVVIVGNDQQEWFYDDLMPSLAVYWGETIPLRARKLPDSAPAYRKAAEWGNGDVDLDVPVNSSLAKHIIESVIERGFDIVHFNYVREKYGGKIGPAGYYQTPSEQSPHAQGLPHGPAWVIRRLMDNKPFPVVPIFQNTFYPPNQPTVKRCYAFGRAIRSAIESWDPDMRVAVIASGGFSHFVIDPEIDDMAHAAFQSRDPEQICAMPESKLQMGTSEIKNWVTAAAALEHLDYHFVARTPGYRSPAGTGHADAFAIWQ